MRALRHQGKIWIHWNGRIYNVSETGARRSLGSGETGELSAPFSSRVLKVYVAKGQSVAKGEPIVVVEAMKMEYTYNSPLDGIIAEVIAKVGETLPAGTAFVRWEPK